MGTEGVQKAVVALATSKGHVEFDPKFIGPRDVINIVEVCVCVCVCVCVGGMMWELSEGIHLALLEGFRLGALVKPVSNLLSMFLP